MRIKMFKRKRESFIKSPEETQRKAIPWGKYIYLGVLGLIVLGLMKWGFGRLVYIKGVGILDAETIKIETKLTARITEIRCSIKEEVYKTAPLVFLDKSELEHKIAIEEREFEEKSSLLKQKIQDLENELQLLEEERKNKIEEVKDIKGEYQRAKDLLALEAITHTQLLDVDYNLKLVERNLSFLSLKYALNRSSLVTLKKEHDELREKMKKEIKQLYGLLRDTTLFPPKDGVVTKIYKQEGEIVQVGDPILEIADVTKNFIKTHFDGSDENGINLGEEVIVIFENGEKSKGKIINIYPTTRPLPLGYKERYGPRERFLIAEVIPVNGEGWSKILGTKAKVMLKRSWL